VAFNTAIARLAGAPGVVAAGAVSSLPLTGGFEGGGIRIEGRAPPPAGQQGPHGQYNVIAGEYFRAMGIRVVSGRPFDTRDDAPGVRSIIVNREFVRQYMAGDTAVLGRIMTPTFTFERNQQHVLVGIVDDVKQAALDAEPAPQMYVPQSQMAYPFLTVVLRTNGDPLAAIPTLKRELLAVDPTFTVRDSRTMQDVLENSLSRQRFSMTLIAIFAVSALVLAIVGLYGVIALIVGQRRREIGVRVALGARPADVVRMVLGESSRMTIAGVVIGVAGAAALTRVLASMLYGVSTTDAATFIVSAIIVALVASAAGLIPARRASRVDPTVALRAD
jgi:predicted permease